MRGLYLVVGLVVFISHVANAQFTSVIDGDWHDGATWGNTSPGTEGVDYPGAATDATLNTNVSIDAAGLNVANVLNLTISAGVSLTVNTGASLYLNGALDVQDDGLGGNGLLTVDGTLRANQGSSYINASEASVLLNGLYEHNLQTTAGTIITAAWGPSSTCAVIGYTTNTAAPGGLNQTFNNFTWNVSALSIGSGISLAGGLANVNGTLRVSSSGTGTKTFQLFGTASNGSLTVGQDVIVEGSSRLVFSSTGTNNTTQINGDLRFENNALAVHTVASSGSSTITVIGNFVEAQTLPATGTITLNLSSLASGSGTLNVRGNFTLGANCSIAKAAAAAAATINFNGSAPTVQDFSNSGTFSGVVNFVVFNNAILNLGTSAVTGTGSFTVSAGGTIQVGSPDGLNTGTSIGNVRVQGSHIYAATSNIVYNGAGSQNLGNEWTTGGAINNVAVNLEIAKPTGQVVTNNNTGSTNVVGNVTLTSGTLNIGGSNSLTIQSDFSATAGVFAGTATSDLAFTGSGTIAVGSTLTFAAGSQTLRNLTIDRSGNIPLGSDLTIAAAGTLTFSQAGNLRLNGHTLTIIGNLSQTGGGALSSSVAGSVLVIGGSGAFGPVPFCTNCGAMVLRKVSFERSSGTYTWNSTVTIGDTVNLESGALTHTTGLTMGTGSTFAKSSGGSLLTSEPSVVTTYNLYYIGNHATTGLELPVSDVVNSLTTAGSVALDKSVIVNGSLNVTSGTLTTLATNTPITMRGAIFNVSGGSINLSSNMIFSRVGTAVVMSGSSINNSQFQRVDIASGTTVNAPNANINIGGQWNNSGTFVPGTGTVTFNSASPQNINSAGQPFFNFATSGAGTKTLQSALDADGSITIGTGSTLSPGANTISVAGTWTNLGTFALGTSTVQFDGATQTIDNNGQAFYNVTIATAASTKTLGAALDVDNQLQIHANATLDVSNSDFPINVAGNFVNSGTFNPRNGTVFLDGTLIQNLGGSTVTTFNNITSSNASTVTVASPQSIAGVLTLTAGTFNPNDNFILRSSAARDAQIAPLSGGATILTGSTNRMTVERYLPNNNGSASYRYLAAPVSNAVMHNASAPIRGWKDNFPITGPFNDPSTVGEWPQFPTMNVANTSIYRYNEATGGTPTLDQRYEAYPLPGTSTTASAIESGRGYAVFVRHSAPTTIEIFGQARINNVTVPVSNSNQTGNINDDGWNLIGNPYASAIDWDNVNAPADARAIVLKDNTNSVGLGAGTHIYYTPGGVLAIPANYGGTIASGQGFWVHKTTPGTDNIIFEENDKVASAQFPFMREGIIDLLRIHVAGNAKNDELLIYFNENGHDAADGALDAFKLDNEFINFSSLSSDGKKLAINTFGPLVCSKEISLALTDVTPGGHAFTFSELESFGEGIEVRLLDTFTGETIKITEEDNTYDFQVTSSADSYGVNRFKVFVGHHDLDLGLAVEALNICDGSDAQVRIQAPQPGVSYTATLNGTTISDNVVATSASEVTISIPKANLTGAENNIVLMAQVSGCGALPLSQSVKIDIQDVPEISSVTADSRCGEGQVTLAANAGTGGAAYKWYLTEDATDPIAGETGSTLIIPTLTKTKTYFVSAVNALGCEGGKMAVTATVNYAHEVAGVTGAAVCPGENSTVSATGAPNDGSYRWYLSENSVEPIPNQSAASYATSPLSSTTTFFVSIVNSTGCESARVPVTVEVTPLADASITVEGNVLISNSDIGNQWHLNGVAIPGATSKNFTATESGVYKLVVSNGNCTTETEKEYSVTGDIEIAGSKGLLLYPNPSNGAVYVEVATTNPVSVRITNQLGAQVAASELKQEGETRKGQLDITGHAAGLYLVIIKSGENTVTRKILKN